MKKDLTIVLWLLFLEITLLSGCSPTEPTESNIQPGRRDYVWAVDTIPISPMTTLTRIGGSGPNDVWTVGDGDGQETVWHYNGVKWQKSNEYLGPGLWAVFSLGPYETWAGDINGRIFKYTGTWEKEHTLKDSSYDYIIIQNIWGTSNKNLFAVGVGINRDSINDKGVIARYNGNYWELLKIPQIHITFTKIGFQQNTGKVFLHGSNNEPGFPDKIFLYENGIFHNLLTSSKSIAMGNLNGEVYFSNDKKIYKYNNNSLQVWRDFSNTIFYGGFFARSEKDIIGISTANQLIHYNGENWSVLFEQKDTFFNDGIFFEKDFFIQGFNSQTNKQFIIRGTLK